MNTDGEMSEWPNEHAWKACVQQCTEGSNPSLSAIHKCIEFMRILRNQFSLFSILKAMAPVVIWVGPRTDNLCEPRQVRKEAAAVKYCRVANQSSSGDILFTFQK